MLKQLVNSVSVKLALLVVGYALLAQAGTVLYTSGSGVAYFWPANALTLAVLLRSPMREWPLLLLAVAATEVSVDRYNAVPWVTSLGLGFANVLEAGAGAGLLRRFIGDSVRLNSLGELFRFGAVALVVPALSAWVGAAALHYGDLAPSYFGAWVVWWMGDAFGLLLVAPVLLTWKELRAKNFGLTSPRRAAELLVLGVALTLVTIFLFSAKASTVIVTPSIIFPFIVWVALRFELAVTDAAMIVTSIIASTHTDPGTGPFAAAGSAELVALDTNAFLLIATVTGMVLAVVATERRRSEASFRNVVEASPVAKLVADRQGMIMLVNAQAERMLGYWRDELIGQSIDTLVPEESRARHGQFRNGYLAAPEFRQMGAGRDLRARRKDGSEVEVEIGLNPIDTDRGPMVLASMVDVSERKRAEHALRGSEQRLRMITHNIPAGIAYLDTQGRFEFCNHMYEVWEGRPRASLYGLTVAELHGPIAGEQVRPYIDRVLAGERVTFERSLRSGGAHQDIEITYVPDFDQRQRVVGYYVLASDITQRRASEQMLRQQHAAMESATDGIALLNANAEYIYLNQAHVRLFGYSDAAELLGKDWRVLYDDSEIRRAKEEILPLLARDGRWSGETMGTRRDGSRFHEGLSLTRIEGGGLIRVCRDITGQKQAQATLEAMLAEKTVLLNEIHHRVKNNLQVISGLLYLQASKAGDAQLKALLEESQNRVNAMAIIHQLLYENGDFGRVRLRQYFERLGRLLASSYGASAKGIDVRVDAQDIDLDLQHSVPLGLLVNELASNSLKHAFPDGRGGEVRIELRRGESSHEAVLSVSDNGIGLAPGIEPKSVKSLGLRLVANLVEQVGGKLKIEPADVPNARGEPGCRFTITFAGADHTEIAHSP